MVCVVMLLIGAAGLMVIHDVLTWIDTVVMDVLVALAVNVLGMNIETAINLVTTVAKIAYAVAIMLVKTT